MKANNERYNAEWTSPNCGEVFGIMEVIDNSTRKVHTFRGVMFPRTPEGLLARAAFMVRQISDHQVNNEVKA